MVPTGRRLARDFHVFAPDLPGFGKSAKPAQVLDVPGLAGALVAWMDAVGLERVSFLGNSLGCQVIVDCAVRYPQRVDRGVLVGPSMDPRAPTALQQAWRVVLDTPHESPSQPFVIARDYLAAGLWRSWCTLQYGLRDPLTAKLPLVQAPMLVVRGGRDPIVPQPWAEEVTRLLPRARLAVLPGAPHTANYSSPDQLVRVARPFLC
jgi:pimeloyl-ACP methyl ester carboxylesterase